MLNVRIRICETSQSPQDKVGVRRIAWRPFLGYLERDRGYNKETSGYDSVP